MENQRRLRAVPSGLTPEQLVQWISEGLAPSPVSPHNFAESFTVMGQLNGKTREFVIEALTSTEAAVVALQLIRTYYSSGNGIISREIWQKGEVCLRDSRGRKYALYSNGLPGKPSVTLSPERSKTKRPTR